MVSIRLVTADSYQAQPLPQLDPTFSAFRGSEIKHVPVIRVFGSTPDGEKTCLHVHGVFPYLFVPYTGEEDPNILAYRLASSLDAAINVSLGSATSNTQHVFSVQRVSGTPFYGYHRKKHQFFKIYFYNPAMIKRAADLLQNGSVLNQSLQPHEAHINYILQFMMDYNIYGMNFVNLRRVKHRRESRTLADLTSSGPRISSENHDIDYLPTEIERQSTCKLEIDALASDILNRLDIEKDFTLNPGLAAIWDEERARRAQAGFEGGDSQLVNPKSPPRPAYCLTDNDVYQEQRLARRLLMISQCDESTLSTTSNRSVAYAAEVAGDENLLNASRLPNVSVQSNERISNVGQEDSLGNISFVDSPPNQASQSITQNCSILETDDMALIDLLAELARDNEESSKSVDADSLLGSQRTIHLSDNEKSDNEDDDVADLNLTSLQLDSLDLLDSDKNSVDKQQRSLEKLSVKTDELRVSPFPSPYEISRSPKSPNDNDTTIKEDTAEPRMPQYDGAGDVSPTLLHPDNGDIQENPDNAKEFDRPPAECNDTSEKLDHVVDAASRKNSSMENDNSAITIERERSKSSETLHDSRDNDCSEIALDAMPSNLASAVYPDQFGSYDSFDRLLEIGADFAPDFVDFQSSMEISALMSSNDFEKGEFVGNSIDRRVPLETVLNGDPCFTESAELDKSDLTELRDQYVSLLGNALLPDIRNNPRIDTNLNVSTSFVATRFDRIEKTSDITSDARHTRGKRVNRDGPSSLDENVETDIQESELQRLVNDSSVGNIAHGRSPQSFKEQASQTSDTSDYNCNVVATWAELQNLQIIDKTENHGCLSRGKTRGIHRKRHDNRSKEISRESKDNASSGSTDRLSESSTAAAENLSDGGSNEKRTVTSCALEDNVVVKNLAENEKSSGVSRTDREERLSCGPLSNVLRLSPTSKKEPEDEAFPTSLKTDASQRPSIVSDNPSSDEKNPPSTANHSTRCSDKNDNLADPMSTDLLNFNDNRVEDPNENNVIDEKFSSGTSYYCPKKSENLLEIANRQHRHCFISKFKKLVKVHAFTSDRLWIIQKRKRGALHRAILDSKICTQRECKLPVVYLEKIEQRRDESVVNVAEKDAKTVEEDSSGESSDKCVKVVENCAIAPEDTSEKRVELPKQEARVRSRKMRGKSEIFSPTTDSKVSEDSAEKILTSISDDATVSNDSISRKLPNPSDSFDTARHLIKHRRGNSDVRADHRETDEIRVKKRRGRRRKQKGSLPGIPGIVNYAASKKMISARRKRIARNGLTEEAPMPRERSSSKLSPSTDSRRKLLPNGVVGKLPADDPTSQKNEILAEKRKRQSLGSMPVSTVPKKNTESDVHEADLTGKCAISLSTSEILERATLTEVEKVRELTNTRKLPETVTLGLMLQEAKSRSTRTALKLLLQKRLSERFSNEKITTKSAMKKNKRDKDETNEDKKSSASSTTEEPIVNSFNFQGTKNDGKSCTTMRDESVEKSGSSDLSFSAATDVSSETDAVNDTLDIDSDKFDNPGLNEEYCDSIDDSATDIFHADETDNSGIDKNTNVEEFPIVAKPIVRERHFYGNEMEDFFASKDYTIDAVSDEIPDCLFEEDSNSIDKHTQKKFHENNIDNGGDPSGATEHNSSESSVHLRDYLDVYDVESLTPTSCLSLTDGVDDATESSIEFSEIDDCSVTGTLDKTESIDDSEISIVERANTVNSEETVAEDETSNEEESPSFEALSPQPRVCSLVGTSLEEEFAVDSKLEATRSRNDSDETLTTPFTENFSLKTDVYSVEEEDKKQNEPSSIRTEETLKEIPEMNENDAKNAECNEEKSLSSSDDDDNTVLPNEKTPSVIQGTVVEEKRFSPCPDVGSLTNIDDCEKLQENTESPSEKREKLPTVEHDEEIFEKSEIPSETLINCQKDNDPSKAAQMTATPPTDPILQSSDVYQNESSTFSDDSNLSGDSVNNFELPPAVKEQDLPPSIRTQGEASIDTKTKALAKNNVLTSSEEDSNVQKCIEKQTKFDISESLKIKSLKIDGENEKLPEVDKNKSAMTFNDEKEVTVVTNGECTMETSSMDESELWEDTSMPVRTTTIFAGNTSFPPSSKNRSEQQITDEKSKEISSNVENEKTAENVDDEMKKAFPTSIPGEPESSPIVVSKNGFLAVVEKPPTLEIADETYRNVDENSCESSKKEENLSSASEYKNEKSIIRLDNGEPEETNEQAKQSEAQIYENPVSVNLKADDIESHIENETICTAVSKVGSGNGEILNNMKNETVDINKNDVVVGDNFIAEGSENQEERRSVSIKLVNVDSSKTPDVARKRYRKTKKRNLSKGKTMSRENSDETAHEQIRRKSEITESEVTTHEGVIVEKTIGQVNSCTGENDENVEKSVTEESRACPPNKGRKRRRRIPKNTRMPERRSIRICAEMTLKMSRRDGSSGVVTGSTDSRDDGASNESPGERVVRESKDSRAMSSTESSMKKSLQSITEDPRDFPTQQASIVQGTKTLPRELALSGETIANENAAPSAMKIQRRERLGKNVRANCREVTLSTKIIDENTAPLYEEAKRRNSQLNCRKTLVEKSAKLKPEETAQENSQKPSTVIDLQPIEFDIKIAGSKGESRNSIISSKKVRSVNGRQSKIRNASTKRRPWLSKSTRGKRNVKKIGISRNCESSTEQNSTDNVNQDRIPAMIFPMPVSDANTVLKSKIIVVEKSDQSLIDKTLLQTPREVACNPLNNLTRLKQSDDEIKSEISVIRKKRGRPAKKSETSEKCLPKKGENVAECHRKTEFSTMEMFNDSTDVKSFDDKKRRNRCASNERKNSIVLEERGCFGKNFETELDSAMSESLLQRMMKRCAKSKTSFAPKRERSSEKSFEEDSHELSLEENLNIVLKERCSQGRHLISQKITDQSLQSETLTKLEKEISGVKTATQTPLPDERENSLLKSKESSMVLRNIMEENVETNISTMPKRRGRPKKKRKIMKNKSAIDENATDFRESTSEKFAADGFICNRILPEEKIVGATAKASSQIGPVSKEKTPQSTRRNVEKTESSIERFHDSVESKGIPNRVGSEESSDPNFPTVSHGKIREPLLVLERLNRDLLKNYGIVYKSRLKKFVKKSKKAKYNHEETKDEEELNFPTYDGPADLSSSDTDEDRDLTIVREERRVCTYASSKKTSSAKSNYLETPKKRKLDFGEEQTSGHSEKRQRTPTASRDETPKKTLNRPLSRTSMLKSPGRLVGNYSPLKIIVTSPKVRKDMLEPRLSIRSEKHNDDVNTSSLRPPTASLTSAEASMIKNSRLRDDVLRGKFKRVDPSVCELGDGHATVGKMESNVVGELDEIRSIGRSEHGGVNAAGRSGRHGSSGIDESTTIFREGKDVRKKLVFSDSLLDGPRKVSSLRAAIAREEPPEDEDSVERTKHPKHRRTMMLDAVAGPSRSNYYVDSSEDDGIDEKGSESNDDDDIDEDDVGNVTFTQFIDSQMNKAETTFSLNPCETSDISKRRIILVPKLQPPNRQKVIDTMEDYGLPKCRNQEPFFGNSADVPKQRELAQKMLKVPGRGVEYLPPFVSSVERVTGLSRWRKLWLNEFHPSLAKSKESSVKIALASDDRIVVTPLAKPPTRKEVQNWLKARRYLERKKVGEIKAVAGKNDEISSKAEVTTVSNDVEDDAASSCKNGEKNGASNLETSCISENISSSKVGGGTSITDPSLLDLLRQSHLFREQQASKHLGISCGQIEFLSDSTRSNVAEENLRNAKALTRYQYLTIMCLEVHITTREDLSPDVQHDPISAIFYSVQSDVPPTSAIKPLEHGVIVLAETEKSRNKMHYSNSSDIPWTISFAKSEEALLNSLVDLVTRTDPEILIGWQIETLSWGYVFQRATHLGINLVKRVSRIPATLYKWEYQAPDIEKLTEVKLPGRIVLDIWRLMRHEAALLSYTFESVMHHVLNERIPCPSFKTLTEWWNLEKPRPSCWRVVEHYGIRVLGVLRILDQLDIIGRTSELARLFGIQFFEVFSRGSQFRVESVMLRLAKPLNYIAVSPSPQQRASMRAMEALPLIMEPESMFYSDPVIVLDFQSLYPSIIIAHNYCFSTCLGRIEHIGQPEPFEFGAYTLRVPKRTALKLQGKVNYAPCGVAYVKSEVRTGILPRMLTEILETRFMVKKAMKDHKRDDKTLQRALHSRQMGLKFLANVTYGYTAANFSGRMPCIEVGDSVISKSKETLERAIKLVESTPKWGARVIYGDTDSLFILVPGKSKADAFVIGNEIADAVTASNLPPIKLKFEKVLFPTILQTKKRYCGYMYETPEQESPTYLAKGIETVRRDGCPAVSKILEKSLKILFETKDLSFLKKYVTRQLDKVLRGKVSIQDLTFAKEFRGLKGYKAKACVPALELTRRLMRKDPRAVPRTSERVRYVIVAGPPNTALIHCVRTPWELINDPGLRPNAIYYVTRVVIPPLNRCLNLMGVDVNDWYREMPHRQILDNPVGQPSDKQKLTIFQYFGTIVCVACGQPSNKGICARCLERPSDTLVVIHEKIRRLDRADNLVTAVCQSCVGRTDVANCASLDCPVLYRRAQARRELTQASQLREVVEIGDNLEF